MRTHACRATEHHRHKRGAFSGGRSRLRRARQKGTTSLAVSARPLTSEEFPWLHVRPTLLSATRRDAVLRHVTGVLYLPTSPKPGLRGRGHGTTPLLYIAVRHSGTRGRLCNRLRRRWTMSRIHPRTVTSGVRSRDRCCRPPLEPAKKTQERRDDQRRRLSIATTAISAPTSHSLTSRNYSKPKRPHSRPLPD